MTFAPTARRLVPALLLLSACAAPMQPPRLQTLRLGTYVADYRDYRGKDICRAEPRWLADELRGGLALVGRFVDAASADLDEAWSEASVDLVQQAQQDLPPLIEALEANLRLLRDCSFADNARILNILKDGPGRLARARRLLPLVPEVLSYVEARARRERWLSGRSMRTADAASRCPASKAARRMRVKQWVQSCDGAEEWLFCDGASLRRAPGQEKPDWTPSIDTILAEPPRSRSRRRRWRPPPPPTREDYVAAAKTFDFLDACPALPSKPGIPAQ